MDKKGEGKKAKLGKEGRERRPGVRRVKKEKEKEVRAGVFLYTGCCIFFATSAPLANQQIPLFPHFGLEHSSFLSMHAEGCSDNWLNSLSPT